VLTGIELLDSSLSPHNPDM